MLVLPLFVIVVRIYARTLLVDKFLCDFIYLIFFPFGHSHSLTLSLSLLLSVFNSPEYIHTRYSAGLWPDINIEKFIRSCIAGVFSRARIIRAVFFFTKVKSKNHHNRFIMLVIVIGICRSLHQTIKFQKYLWIRNFYYLNI